MVLEMGGERADVAASQLFVWWEEDWKGAELLGGGWSKSAFAAANEPENWKGESPECRGWGALSMYIPLHGEF